MRERAEVLSAVVDWAESAELTDAEVDALIALYEDLLDEGARVSADYRAGRADRAGADERRMELRQEGREQVENLLDPQQLTDLRRVVAAAGGGRL